MKEARVGLVLTLREGAKFDYCQKLVRASFVRGWSLLNASREILLGDFILYMIANNQIINSSL